LKRTLKRLEGRRLRVAFFGMYFFQGADMLKYTGHFAQPRTPLNVHNFEPGEGKAQLVFRSFLWEGVEIFGVVIR
jgi:hypothetical protein